MIQICEVFLMRGTFKNRNFFDLPICSKCLSIFAILLIGPYEIIPLKGQGHVTVKKPVISIIYIVAHTWSFCSAQIFVDGVNPK